MTFIMASDWRRQWKKATNIERKEEKKLDIEGKRNKVGNSPHTPDLKYQLKNDKMNKKNDKST